MSRRNNPLFKKTTPVEPEIVDEGLPLSETLFNESFPGDAKPLSKREKDRLAELEEIIIRNFKAFHAVGCALREVRDSKLYRQTHTTFEAYHKEMWDIASSQAYRYIDAADVVDHLIAYTPTIKNFPNWGKKESPSATSPIGEVILPQNEAQARVLVKFKDNPQQQLKIWQQAVKTAENGRITAAHVRKTAKALHGKKVGKQVNKVKKKLNSERTMKMSTEFVAAFDAFLDAINNERLNDWKTTDRKEVQRHLRGLVEVVSAPC